MHRTIKLFVIGILLSFYSFSINAATTSALPGKKPDFIPVIKKPCYIGCDYMFQFCYYYNISNMENAIKVKEWNVEKGYISGKAVADIKAKLLIKMCYQLSLTSAYPVLDKEINMESEFEFKIKINGDGKEKCIEFQEGAITYHTYELKGEIDTDPIPAVQGQLGHDLGKVIQASVSKTVYDFLSGEGKKVYCVEEYNNIFEDNESCPCD